MNMRDIANELNKRCISYKMNYFQEIRSKIRNFDRVNSDKIFSEKSVKDGYAFHSGGRSEFQYNLGFEEIDGENFLRYGVAFSFESSNYYEPDKIREIFFSPPPYPNRVERYNQFLQNNYAKEKLNDLKFWYYDPEKFISDIVSIQTISENLMKVGYFIFIGKLIPVNKIDYDDILKTFDNLLPLYVYVEGGDIKDFKILDIEIDSTEGDSGGNDEDLLTFDTIFPGDDHESEEGRKLLKKHYVRERNHKLIKIAKENRLKKDKYLRCEVCNFSFVKKYGELGFKFIEGHHIKPISDMKPGNITKVEDIALVCSNCHRMIHRNSDYISIEELKAMINNKK